MTMERRLFDITPLGCSSIGLLAVVLVVAGCTSTDQSSGGAGGEQHQSVAAVEVAPVESKTIPREVRVPTTLAPSRTLQVTPEVGGVAERIYREQGESVDKGDPLVRIASPNYALAVDSARSQQAAARAGIKQAKARLETAKNQYERFKKLYEDEVVAKAQFEEVKAGYEQAKAAYESAKARAEQASTGVEQARTRVRDTIVRAPFAGHVVRRMIDEGSVVRPMAQPVMVLIDDDPIRAEASVGELKVPHVKEGMATTVRIDAFPDRTFEGEISMVNRQINPRTREAAIRVVLPNEEGKLRAGMAGRVTIRLGERDRLVVPRTALFAREGSQAAVYVVESGTAHRRSVEIEAGFEKKLPVTEGLSAGERVITWGIDDVNDGDPVDIQSGGEASPASSSESDSSDNERGAQ